MSALAYMPSPIARARRTTLEMTEVRDAIYQVCVQDRPVTVRQVFYRLVSLGVIAKTETEYKQTVGRLLVEMRREGVIPFGWIADNTRWMRKPESHASLGDALGEMQHYYRRALWRDQAAYVEVWLEKDALSGVLYEVTEEYDVPLMVTRGYASESFLHDAAEAMSKVGKPAFIYYFGDFDPSGVNIPQVVERRLRAFAPQTELTFERVAVNQSQIARFGLPTRPTKASDTRAKRFQGESVEVDAIPPADLRRLVQECITQHIDGDALKRTVLIESAERDSLAQIAAGLPREAA